MTEPRHLMALDVTDHADIEPEPVLIHSHDQVVDLELGDGRILQLNRAELRAAIDEPHEQAA